MKINKPTTRVIAGKYKNRVLELPPLEVTRSSKARLKESFFNVLQFDIIGKIFIESFAGSGSIGLEALSRGAKRSYFVELNKDSYNVLVRNCKAIDMDSCQTMQGDTLIQTPSILNSLKNSSDEIILYIDPPFDYRDGMNDIYMKSFNMIEQIENENIYMIVLEHVTTLDIPEKLGNFTLDRTKKFGKSSLSYFSCKKQD